MALDLTKLAAAVHQVATLAASHSAANAVAAAAAADEQKAQADIDALTSAIEAALAQVVPVDQAGATGLSAVAAALTHPAPAAAPAAPAEPPGGHPKPNDPPAVGVVIPGPSGVAATPASVTAGPAQAPVNHPVPNVAPAAVTAAQHSAAEQAAIAERLKALIPQPRK